MFKKKMLYLSFFEDLKKQKRLDISKGLGTVLIS